MHLNAICSIRRPICVCDIFGQGAKLGVWMEIFTEVYCANVGKHRQLQIGHLMADSVGCLHVYIASLKFVFNSSIALDQMEKLW